MNHHLIVIDDEINIQRSVETCATSSLYSVAAFSDPIKALPYIQNHNIDIAIIDVCLTNCNGIDFYRELRQQGQEFPVIFISGNASLSEAAECMKVGAFDFIEKPFSGDKLLFTLKNCSEQLRLKRKLAELEQYQTSAELIGNHESIHTLRREIEKVARVDSVVLIAGESGTGKELIAENIHRKSKRSAQPFIKVNCSAIPLNLHESALFGHIKGAFTGADSNRKGFFEAANFGTIFLDEIGDMPIETQASMLRVIEYNEIQKVGSEKVSHVDVRILAASHKNLKKEVEAGRFREDLYYRINVVPILSPPLRDRASDIPLLVSYMLQKKCREHGFSERSIDPACFGILQKHPWPGNIRELINTVERMLIMGGDKLFIDDIPMEIRTPKEEITQIEEETSLKDFLKQAERRFIVDRLKKYGGNISKLAKSLNVDRTNLHKKLAQHDIRRESFFK